MVMRGVDFGMRGNGDQGGWWGVGKHVNVNVNGDGDGRRGVAMNVMRSLLAGHGIWDELLSAKEVKCRNIACLPSILQKARESL